MRAQSLAQLMLLLVSVACLSQEQATARPTINDVEDQLDGQSVDESDSEQPKQSARQLNNIEYYLSEYKKPTSTEASVSTKNADATTVRPPNSEPTNDKAAGRSIVYPKKQVKASVYYGQQAYPTPYKQPAASKYYGSTHRPQVVYQTYAPISNYPSSVPYPTNYLPQPSYPKQVYYKKTSYNSPSYAAVYTTPAPRPTYESYQLGEGSYGQALSPHPTEVYSTTKQTTKEYDLPTEEEKVEKVEKVEKEEKEEKEEKGEKEEKDEKIEEEEKDVEFFDDGDKVVDKVIKKVTEITEVKKVKEDKEGNQNKKEASKGGSSSDKKKDGHSQSSDADDELQEQVKLESKQSKVEVNVDERDSSLDSDGEASEEEWNNMNKNKNKNKDEKSDDDKDDQLPADTDTDSTEMNPDDFDLTKHLIDAGTETANKVIKPGAEMTSQTLESLSAD